MNNAEQRVAATRAKLVAAAIELHGDGDNYYSLADVAKRAGVGTATAYRHFEDSFDLQREIRAEQDTKIRRLAFIADFPLHQSRREDGLAVIAAAVAAEAGISATALRDRTRRHAISHARHEAILRQIEAGYPAPVVGRWWNYDQTTIRHACQSARANRANGRLREVILCAPGAEHE